MVELARSEFPRSPWGCAFLAYNSATDANQTGAGVVTTVAFDTEVFDLGDDFAWAAGPARWQFTAPATGTYFLATTVMLGSLAAAHTDGYAIIMTSNRQHWCYGGDIGAMRGTFGVCSLQVITLADMDAADTAYVDAAVVGGAQVVSFRGHATNLYTYFCGHRVS